MRSPAHIFYPIEKLVDMMEIHYHVVAQFYITCAYQYPSIPPTRSVSMNATRVRFVQGLNSILGRCATRVY